MNGVAIGSANQAIDHSGRDFCLIAEQQTLCSMSGVETSP